MRVSFALLIVFLSLSESLADSNTLWNETNVDKLKKDLLKDYDKFSRPEHHRIATKCEISLTLLNIDLDETKGTLSTHAWMKMNWSDSKLSWDNASYGGIDSLHLTADEIWQPDLTVYNSAEPNIVDHFAKTNKIVYYNGYVLWVPTAKFETYCPMNLQHWPFDTQKCIIKIGSWTYSGHQIDLQAGDLSKAIDLTHYMSNPEWTILKGSVERNSKVYPCCPDPYIDITFEIVFQRQSPMYKAIAVTPAIVVVLMTLVSFWLPPQAGEKLLLNGLACVLICILLMYFSRLLPILAANPPLIVTFYSHTLYLLCISLIISVIVINMSRNRKQYAVPHSIKANILDGFIGKALGGAQPEPLLGEIHGEELRETPFEEQRNSDDHQIIQTASKTSPRSILNDWIRLAIIIERATFFIFVFAFVMMGFLHLI